MGTTTKMAIPYPEATGLVKDGWEDMKDIATQVDAKSGLVLINSTTFSGVSSQAINDVFNSNYDNYRIIVDLEATSTSNELWLRLRVSGTDTSTNYYRSGWYVANGGSSGSWYAGNPGSEVILIDGGTDTKTVSIDVYYPNKNVETNFSGFSRSPGQSNTFGVHQSASTQFTGFNLITSAGTMAGRVLTYGYNQ